MITAFTACEEDEAPYLGPVEEISDGIRNGAWVTMDLTNIVIDFENLSGSALTADLEDLSGTVAEYRVYTSWVRGSVVSDTALVKTISSFPSELSVSAQEIADALDSTINDFQAGDRVNFVAEITAQDGTVTRIWPPGQGNVGSDLFGNPGQKQALSFSAFVACPIEADFTGAYSMEQIQGPGDVFFGAPTAFYPVETSVSAPNLITRTWAGNYVSFSVNFTILMLCGNVDVPRTASGVGCGGPGLNWIQDPTLGPASYNPSDDSTFDLNIITNVDGGCGVPPTPQTILRMTKL